MEAPLTNPLIWIDCEMSGLDDTRFHIIEIAVIVTDGVNLDRRIYGPELVIQCPEEELAAMDEWCTKTHTESGLVEKVRASPHTLKSAEQQILTFLQDTCGLKPFTCQIAGNSVGCDKRFLAKDMPDLYKFLHYRIVDVTVLSELSRRWLPALPRYQKKSNHRALDDIEESIEELKHYQKHIFSKV